MAIKIIIADDHEIFRSGLRAFLEKENDIVIIGESGNGNETIDIVMKSDVDVLILDISMPGPPSGYIVEELLKEKPGLAIIILTMHEDEYYLQEMLKKGVRGFVLKKSSGTNLVTAIIQANEGNYYIDPTFTGYLVSSITGTDTSISKSVKQLTKREQEILKLLALGYTNSEIADKLYISKRTVETHRSNIMSKLGLKNKAELVRFAMENRIIDI
ncbi:response regulator [candidate division KSB1 bacterium]